MCAIRPQVLHHVPAALGGFMPNAISAGRTTKHLICDIGVGRRSNLLGASSC